MEAGSIVAKQETEKWSDNFGFARYSLFSTYGGRWTSRFSPNRLTLESAVCSRDICYLFWVKTALYGRIAFGVSAVLFGVIALMWHDPDTWQNLRHIRSLPIGTILGGCLMTAQVAGGIGMQYARTARPASVVL
ncbi:MAG TPA: hypothetical protein VED66_06645, partial [Candidatus Sulfotelmatobacter sp.]|nr:hypothetical protein [Candidatus Sulfotelmatobacter sp.]